MSYYKALPRITVVFVFPLLSGKEETGFCDPWPSFRPISQGSSVGKRMVGKGVELWGKRGLGAHGGLGVNIKELEGGRCPCGRSLEDKGVFVCSGVLKDLPQLIRVDPTIL